MTCSWPWQPLANVLKGPRVQNGHFPFRLIIKTVSMSTQEHKPLIKDCITAVETTNAINSAAACVFPCVSVCVCEKPDTCSPEVIS